MPITPDPPFPKSQSDTIRSKDWNDLVIEIQRLDSDKVDNSGDQISGSLTVSGSLGVGLTSPQVPLDIAGGQGNLTATEGDLRIGSATNRLKIGVDTQGADAGDVRIRAHGGSNRLVLGSGTTDVLTVRNGNAGIGTVNPGFRFHQIGADHVIEDSPISLRRAGNHRWRFEEGASTGLQIRQMFNDANVNQNAIRMQIADNGNVGIGAAVPSQRLDVDGNIRVTGAIYAPEGPLRDNAGGWIRTYGNTGWYSQTHNGGWYMQDTSWIRSYGNKGIYQNAGILRTDGTFQMGSNGSRFRVDTSGNMYIMNRARFLTGLVGSSKPGHNYLRILTQEATNSTQRSNLYCYSDGVVYMPYKLGIRTSDPGADTLDVRGRSYSSGGWHTTNADYAEFFETYDGKAVDVATPVVLMPEGKVRAAKKGEVPIGITTRNSALVGNSYKEWPKKYLRDKFGQPVMESVKQEIMVPKKETVTKERQKTEAKTVTEEIASPKIVLENGKYIQKEEREKVTREIEEPVFKEVDLYDSEGKEVIGKHRIPVMETYEEEIDVLDDEGQPVMVGSGEFETEEQPKVNPDYDEAQEYVLREDRPEWCCVGLLGQLSLRKGKPTAPGWSKLSDLGDGVELWLVR